MKDRMQAGPFGAAQHAVAPCGRGIGTLPSLHKRPRSAMMASHHRGQPHKRSEADAATGAPIGDSDVPVHRHRGIDTARAGASRRLPVPARRHRSSSGRLPCRRRVRQRGRRSSSHSRRPATPSRRPAAQRRCVGERWLPDAEIRVRMGVSTGVGPASRRKLRRDRGAPNGADLRGRARRPGARL